MHFWQLWQAIGFVNLAWVHDHSSLIFWVWGCAGSFSKFTFWLLAILKCTLTICRVLPRKYFKRMPCTLQNQRSGAFGMLSRTSVSATPRQFGVLQKTVSWDVITARWLELFLTNPKVGAPWVTTQQPNHYISQTPAQQISAISSDCWHHPRAEKAKFLHCLGPSAWTRPMHKTSCCLSTAGTDRGHFQDGPMMTESWRQWSYDNLLYWLVSVFVQLNEISSGQISLHTVKKSQMLEWKLYLVSYFLCWI